jgi:hypothetical protein
MTEYADNYIVMKTWSGDESEEGQKQFNLSSRNLVHIEERIKILKRILKDETTSSDNSIREE